MLATIRTSALVGFEALVADLGGNFEHLLSQVHIDQTVLARQDNTIPFRSFIKLLDTTATALDCKTFGLQLAKRQGFEQLGTLALIGLNSSTVGDAVASMSKYLDFHSPASFGSLDTASDPKNPKIIFDIRLEGVASRRQLYELAIGLIYQELLVMTRGVFAAEAIFFKHSTPLPIAIYRNYFHAPVFFEQDVNAVVLKPDDLKKRIDKANPQMREMVAEYVRQASSVHGSDITSQVRLLINRLLPTGDCGIQQVAKNLSMHQRTLQRKLRDENSVFEKILDEVRAERAAELLMDSKLSMGQIAMTLGYLSQQSFNRSCERWFGMSPMRMRRSKS